MITATDEIKEGVLASVRQTLFLPPDAPVDGRQLLFYDLNFTSMDLLDLLFRLEDCFHISIPEGTLYRLALGDIPEEQFAEKEILTQIGRERLITLLFDSPKEIFPDRIHTSMLPKYCTVNAMVRLVEHKLRNNHV
jgi:hypothetical protein